MTNPTPPGQPVPETMEDWLDHLSDLTHSGFVSWKDPDAARKAIEDIQEQALQMAVDAHPRLKHLVQLAQENGRLKASNERLVEYLHNAVALWRHHSTDATQELWLKLSEETLAEGKGEPK